MLISNVPPSTATVPAGAVECVSIVLSPGAICCIDVSSICHSCRLIRADYPVDIAIGVVIGGSKAVARMMFSLIAALRIVRDLERSLLRLDRGRQPLRAGQREVDGEGDPPDAAGYCYCKGAEHNRS